MSKYEKKEELYKKWYFWIIVVLVIIVLILIRENRENDTTNDIGDEGISLLEFNAIEVGKTDILELKGLIGYTDKNFDKIVIKVEEPVYKKDLEGNTHIIYKQKYVGENNEGYAIITIERYLNEFIVIDKQCYNLK